MVMKLNKNDLPEEDIIVANKLDMEKKKAFILPLLVLILMFLILFLNLVMKIDTSLMMLITFIFSIVINSYVLYKVKQTKELMSIILTAHQNNISTKQLFNLPREQFEKLHFVNVSWSTYLLEYFMIIFNAYICTSVFFMYI